MGPPRRQSRTPRWRRGRGGRESSDCDFGPGSKLVCLGFEKTDYHAVAENVAIRSSNVPDVVEAKKAGVANEGDEQDPEIG